MQLFVDLKRVSLPNSCHRAHLGILFTTFHPIYQLIMKTSFSVVKGDAVTTGTRTMLPRPRLVGLAVHELISLQENGSCSSVFTRIFLKAIRFYLLYLKVLPSVAIRTREFSHNSQHQKVNKSQLFKCAVDILNSQKFQHTITPVICLNNCLKIITC